MKTYFTVILVIGFALLGGERMVFAQTHTISPLVIEHEVEARDQIEESIKITNTTDRVLRIFATVNEVTMGEDGGVQTFVPPAMADTATSVTSWIEIQRGRIEIQPRETIRIPLRIAVGLNAAPGEYYAFVGLPDASKRDEAEMLVKNGGAPGIVVRLSIADTAREVIQLDGFSADRFIVNQADRTIAYTLENTGDVPVTPSGDIIFYSVSGSEVAAVPVAHDVALAPRERKEFSVPLPEEVAMGKHKALLRLDYGASSRASLYDTAFFTVVPLPFLIGTFLLLLSLSVFVSLWYHKRYRHIPLHHDTDDVQMFVREGQYRDAKDHDLHLKK